jgi:hypothetical protein
VSGLKVQSKWLDEIQSSTSNQQLVEIGNRIKGAGYTGFYEIQDYIRESFKRTDEANLNEFNELVNKIKTAVPNPGEISPSWEYFWRDLDRMTHLKDKVFNEVHADTREGEWQVIIDNPFSHDNVACYPMLSFLEGVYLYCYFSLNLKKNEYLRLQKIASLVTMHGE